MNGPAREGTFNFGSHHSLRPKGKAIKSLIGRSKVKKHAWAGVRRIRAESNGKIGRGVKGILGTTREKKIDDWKPPS